MSRILSKYGTDDLLKIKSHQDTQGHGCHTYSMIWVLSKYGTDDCNLISVPFDQNGIMSTNAGCVLENEVSMSHG